jgi:hypothetical protein
MKKDLEFQVKLTAKDLWQFSMYHSYIGFSGIFAVIFTAASVFLLVTRFDALLDYQKVLLVVCILLFTIWQPILLYYKAMKQAKRPGMEKPMQLFFGEEGLLVRQEEQEVKFTWEQIGRADRLPTMAIIYMDRVHAYLIPKSVMGADEEAFYEMVKARLPKGRTRRF